MEIRKEDPKMQSFFLNIIIGCEKHQRKQPSRVEGIALEVALLS